MCREVGLLHSFFPRLGVLIAVASLLLAMAGVASAATVVANVDLSAQRMHVRVNGQHYASWRISSGRRGYRTPVGTWKPKWLKRMHYSSKYHNSPMPYSVFYYRGYAVHGTNYIRRLGRPASHGCTRLHPANARKFFNLVKRHGRVNTLIRVGY
jgi:lipoprotein-anchoring transpeptidase ErfK/SrfK